MATNSTAVFEVRVNGSKTNGGGWDPAISGAGTDYSQQDSAQLTVTDAACTGNTTLTSATGGFTAAMVGNALTLIFSGSFQGHWWVVGFTSTNQVTLDKNGPNHTGMTMSLGGASTVTDTAFPFISTGPFAVAGNKIWIKGPGSLSGDYTPTTNDPTLSVAGTKHNPFVVEGYTTTRGDGGRPTILTGGTIDSLIVSANFVIVKNLHPMKASGNFRSLNVTGITNTFKNCIFDGGTPVRCANGSNYFLDCEIKSASGTNPGLQIVGTGNVFTIGCSIHNNGGAGIDAGTSGLNSHRFCDIYANGTDGINFPSGFGGSGAIEANNIWNNGRDGIRFDTTQAQGPFAAMLIQRNIFGKNAGYDLNYTVADASATAGMSDWATTMLDCNAFYTTGTGRYHNIPSNSGDLVLTTSPFTSDTDFTLNNTTGGGTSIRNGPCVSTLPDSNSVYSYIGASAPQTAASTTELDEARDLWRKLTNERKTSIPTNSEVDIWIHQGLQALNEITEYYVLTSSSLVTMVAGTQEYALDSGVLKIEFVEWNGKELAKTSVEALRKRERNWRQEPAGQPKEYAYEANKLILVPTPDAASVAVSAAPTIRYLARPPSPSDSAFDQLPRQAQRLAVYFGASLWSACYPDSATAQVRLQNLENFFEKGAAAFQKSVLERGVSR